MDPETQHEHQSKHDPQARREPGCPLCAAWKHPADSNKIDTDEGPLAVNLHCGDEPVAVFFDSVTERDVIQFRDRIFRVIQTQRSDSGGRRTLTVTIVEGASL